MSVHLTDEEIRNYHQHNLSGQRLLTADLHLTECEDCFKRVGERSAISMKNIVGGLHQEFSDTARLEQDHIVYEQLELMVDGKLDDMELEITESHLEVCKQCRNEADDLRNFRESFNRSAQDSPRVISWHRTAFNVGLRIAGVAAMIAFFVWAASLSMRDRINKLQVQLEQAKDENARLTLKNSELVRQSNQLQNEIATLKSPAQAPIVASLKDGGGIVSLDEKGNILGIASDSPLYLKMAKDALTEQSVGTPNLLAGLIGKQGSLLGESENRPFDLIAPVGTVLLEGRPNFRWKTLKDATGYRVRVYDRDFKEVASSEVLKDTNWIPTNSFQRGEKYSWIVTAYLSDKEVSSPVPPAPEARFMVLDSAKYKELQEAKLDVGRSHLLSGLVYAQFGMLDESVQEFQQLAVENPDSQIAKKLLDRVNSLRKK